MPGLQPAALSAPMKRLLTPLFLMVGLAAFLTACNSTSRIIANGLAIELTAIEPQTDGTVKVSWHVANSNVVSYLLSRVQLKISLNGNHLGTIEDLQPLPVPQASNSGRTTVLKPSAQAAKLLAELSNQTVRYQVETKITILIYGDEVEDSKLSNAGSVRVSP